MPRSHSVLLTIPLPALARLDDLAWRWGLSRSAAVRRLVADVSMPAVPSERPGSEGAADPATLVEVFRRDEAEARVIPDPVAAAPSGASDIHDTGYTAPQSDDGPAPL